MASTSAAPRRSAPALEKAIVGPVTATLLDAETGEEATILLSPDAAANGNKASKKLQGKKAHKKARRLSGEEAIIRHRFAGSGREAVLRVPGALLNDNRIDPPCPACGCKHLYVQRDFNRALGVGIVVAAALVGAVWSGWQGTIYPLLAMLAVATLFDAIIYSVMPPVVVCYKCLTCYRNIRVGESIVDYDQAIADGYVFSGRALGSGYQHGEEK
jgi:hypothetical protein